jgi:hypothetical protein
MHMLSQSPQFCKLTCESKGVIIGERQLIVNWVPGQGRESRFKVT